MHRLYKIDGFPVVEPRPDNIPDELKTRCRWAVWTAEPKAGSPGKFAKAPRSPVSGFRVGADKPENFGTFGEAAAALETGRYSGLGVVLSTDTGVVGVDIDNYRDLFESRPAVKAWLGKARAAGAYCEKSPSGDGLRLFIGGKLANGLGRRDGGLEVYSGGRFLTVTGAKLRESRMELIEGQALIDELLALLPDRKAPVSSPAPAVLMSADPETVERLANRIADEQPELWRANWQGEVSGSGNLATLGVRAYPSQSDADLALCGHIARVADSEGVSREVLPETIRAVFERSGLLRDKWETRDDYRERTISLAIAGLEAAERVTAKVAQGAGAEFADHEPGDILAGKHFARAMRGKLLHVGPAGKWLSWDGTRWVWCARGEEMAAAKVVAGKILKYAAELFAADPNKHGKLLGFAKKLQNLPRLMAMVELAKSEEGMSLGHMSELDSDPWLLGVRNGVVNLRDGGLLAASPDMLITRQAAAEYHSDAQCPLWLNFHDQVFLGDQETIRYRQRAYGYSLTGDTGEEVLFADYGNGVNGKSVSANVACGVMGDYAQTAPASLLTVRRADDTGARNDLAMLCGARLVSINETQSGDRLDEQIVKQLAGREPISARFLHKEFFQFQPTAKPWLRTNHKPIITGEDDGIWRRIHLIPFARKFSEDERDPWLESKLLEERDGILAWMVQGCLEWQRHGLKPSALVRKESATYRKESDLLGEFLDEMTAAAPDARVEQARLFAVYRQWHESNGTRPGSKTSFTRKLTERGYTVGRSNGERFYCGLRLAQATG